MTHQRDLDAMLAAISDEETLEAQLARAEQKGLGDLELRRLGHLIDAAIESEVRAEGEDDRT
jgi:hypothetical protein